MTTCIDIIGLIWYLSAYYIIFAEIERLVRCILFYDRNGIMYVCIIPARFCKRVQQITSFADFRGSGVEVVVYCYLLTLTKYQIWHLTYFVFP